MYLFVCSIYKYAATCDDTTLEPHADTPMRVCMYVYMYTFVCIRARIIYKYALICDTFFDLLTCDTSLDPRADTPIYVYIHV